MSGDPIETPWFDEDVSRAGGSPTVWEFLLERLRHKGSAGLGLRLRSFGEACFSIVVPPFRSMHVIMSMF